MSAKRFIYTIIVFLTKCSFLVANTSKEYNTTHTTINIVDTTIRNKQLKKSLFLITEKSVGLFSVNDTIGRSADFYGWPQIEDSEWYDGCIKPTKNIGGLVLYYKFAFSEDAPQIDRESISKDSLKYTFSKSDNCTGFYYRDSISRIEVYSEIFKTKEGIGIGSTVSDLQQEFTGLEGIYGVDPDGKCINYIKVTEYPRILFRFACEAVSVDVDKESSLDFEKKNSSLFKPDASIITIEMY